MGWKDEKKKTVGTDWGKVPSQAEPVTATTRFATAANARAVYPLDVRGQRKGPSLTPDAAGAFAIGPEQATLWYEVEFGDGGQSRVKHGADFNGRIQGDGLVILASSARHARQLQYGVTSAISVLGGTGNGGVGNGRQT